MEHGNRFASLCKGSAIGLCLAVASAFGLGNLHPYFTVKHILPAEMNNVGGIGGIDLLPNGDGAVCIWGGSSRDGKGSQGEVWIIPNLASGTPGTPVRIATGLREPLGVKTVGNDFYVMEKPRIDKFTGSGTNWTHTVLWSLPTAWYNDAQWHHFSFNLVYRDSSFWFTTGMAYDYDPNDPLQRGALIRVPLAGGTFGQYARGLRETNGVAIGPDDEFFTTDNQGHWRPADAMFHIPTKNIPTNGRFYGFRTKANNACGVTPDNIAMDNCPADPEYPPAIWIPYGGFSNSPTRPILLKDGPYAGQMISGDVFYGGTLRYFLEKVNGEWQGAVFSMMSAGTAGIDFGINQFLYTPSGSLLAIGIGGGTCDLGGSGNWNWNGTCRGLDLLTPTGKTAFEMLAIRAIPGGFDVEFTQPAGAAAGVAANWNVKTTVFTPVQTYGGDSSTADNNVPVAVKSAALSADGKHVTLQLASTSTRRMYAITANNITSATGNQALYTNAGYYTLNNVAAVTGLAGEKAGTGTSAGNLEGIRIEDRGGSLQVTLPFEKPYAVSLYDLSGRKVAAATGSAPQTLSLGRLRVGIYFLEGNVGDTPLREKLMVR